MHTPMVPCPKENSKSQPRGLSEGEQLGGGRRGASHSEVRTAIPHSAVWLGPALRHIAESTAKHHVNTLFDYIIGTAGPKP